MQDKSSFTAYKTSVIERELEQALANFEQVGTLVSDAAIRQVWKFQFQDRPYFLYFYPRQTPVAQYLSGQSAVREFFNFQSLQRNHVPSPRALAHLSGFHIGKKLGDAVIVDSFEKAVPLDEYLENPRPAEHRTIAGQVVEIVKKIGAAKMGHRELSLHSFLIADGKIQFLDARRLQRGGLRLNDLYTLAHNAAGIATRTDLLRGWRILNPDSLPPKLNPMSKTLSQKLVRQSQRENESFGTIEIGEWSGVFTKTAHRPKPWAMASHLNISQNDWKTAWPILLAQIESEQLTHLKRDASGEVLAGEIVLAGRPISVIVKRPRRKRMSQYINDLLRPARARRMWLKAWSLIARNLPCEWPMLLMEKRSLGYAIDSIILFEKVPGIRLDRADLNSLEPGRRDMLFRRAGRTLRTIEKSGLVHYDSKSTNWIIFEDPRQGAIPVMIDLDGIRSMNLWLQAWGVLRLLRAMKQHPQYTPADSLALCQGYAPFSPLPQPEESNVSP
ncbi:MAG TPA: hypothetical protein VHD56_19155 [Tepidisphaeraceae bacterium]|nr:hypothetical protein [Tepidisphaeraceae bacterium]